MASPKWNRRWIRLPEGLFGGQAHLRMHFRLHFVPADRSVGRQEGLEMRKGMRICGSLKSQLPDDMRNRTIKFSASFEQDSLDGHFGTIPPGAG